MSAIQSICPVCSQPVFIVSFMIFCWLVTELWLNLLILQQFEGSCIIEAILTHFILKQIHVLVIQIHYQFMKILPIGHLLTAQFVDFKSVLGQ